LTIKQTKISNSMRIASCFHWFLDTPPWLNQGNRSIRPNTVGRRPYASTYSFYLIFLSISVLMGLVIVTHLGPEIDRSDNRALSQKAKLFAGAALLNHIQIYEAKRFTVSTVTSHGEPSIVSMKQVLYQNNITLALNFLGRGSDAHHAESAICHFQNKARSTAHSLPPYPENGLHSRLGVRQAARCRARLVLNVTNR
jgi:hypothetical protein